MCGIAVEWNGDINKSLEKIKHRGLVNGIKQKDNLSFGHVRLPIQGLDPEFNGPYIDGNNIILYNGEIYNYKELDSKARCDVQLLKDIAPVFFDGDFAVVKYNTVNKRIVIYTDRFGKKQLYYRTTKSGLIDGISSEVKSLVNHESEIDMHYMGWVSRFGYVFDTDLTPITNIKKFRPGTQYIIDLFGNIISKLKMPFNSYFLTNCIPNDLYSLMELSVARRLVSDIPVCLVYSGGLDSSIILHHLHKMNQNIKIFTVENSDDFTYAERYAKELGYDITPIKIDEDEYENAHYYNELATDLGSVLPKYSLFKEIAKHGYRVAIGGTGADEVFGGYSRMQRYDTQYNDIFNELIYYHLPRVDKLSMAHTIEYRTPYTADYIIDFGLKLSYDQRINKQYLRNAYKNKLPDYILNRKKTALKTALIEGNEIEERNKLLKFYQSTIFPRMKQ